MKYSFSRRNLFKWGILGLASLPVVGQLFAQTKEDGPSSCPAGMAKIAAKFDDPAVQPAAKRLLYHPHTNQITDAKAAEKYKKMTEDNKKQFAGMPANCQTCSFYVVKAGDNCGKCTMLAGLNVHSTGWCTSYKGKKKA